MALNLKPKVAQTQAETEVPTLQRSVGRRNGTRTVTQAPAFVRAQGETKRRVIANIQGEEKSGKNHFAFSYTGGPIYVHSFDIGLEGVVQKFQDTREIYVAEYQLTIQPGEATDKEVGEAANVVWDQFVSNYKDSISATQDSGMVVVDTATEAWELLRLASFGKLTQVMPHHYAKPNAEFRDIVRSSFSGSNVAWLSKMVDEWENYVDSSGKEKGRKTGRKARKGFGDLPFLVQVTVETQRTDLAGGGSDFAAIVVDHRLNPMLNGVPLNNDFDEMIEMSWSL